MTDWHAYTTGVDPDARTDIDREAREALVAGVRTTVGDSLRSVLHFTPAGFDVLYVRRDLYGSPAAARAAKAPLVDVEAAGFAEATIRTAVGDREDGGVGPYRFTVRVHDRGYVVRIIAGDAGVLLTTDDVDFEAFEDAAAAVAAYLAAR